MLIPGEAVVVPHSRIVSVVAAFGESVKPIGVSADRPIFPEAHTFDE